MLIDLPEPRTFDPMTVFLRMGTAASGNGAPARLDTGMYRIGHWNPEMEFPDCPRLRDYRAQRAYGVCDSPEQVLAKYPEFAAPEHEYVMFFVPVNADDQPADGGWRWSKWGEYIGTGEPKCEYIYDEPVLRSVMTFSVYEVS